MNIVRLQPRLPIWPDAVRGGPNALLRSALFAGIHSSRRQFIGIQKGPDTVPEGVELASQDGITLKYAGLQLNQYDADVFFELLHRARRHELSFAVTFAGNEFLNAIGRSGSKETYKDLDNSLRRLKAGLVDVQWRIVNRPYTFRGSLVNDDIRETDSKLYRVTLSAATHSLFAPSSWTQLEWSERMSLKGKPLAQWLHSYYSTHAKPFAITVAFLKEKTGSPTKLEKHFKPELRAALTHLEEILGWAVEWDDNRVTVHRAPSESQQRHLNVKDVQRRVREGQRNLFGSGYR